MAKRVTIKEVAEDAGVTIGTVSHVINGTASISAETTSRVKESIEKLAYIPNLSARNMRAKNNHTVGLMIPKMSNVFYSRIASTFMEEADKNGCTVMLLNYEYKSEREKREIQSLIQNRIEIIVLVNGKDDEDFLRETEKGGTRFILADRRSKIESIPYAEYDNIIIMEEAVRYLAEKGYSSIGYLTEPVDFSNLKDRYTGFQRALERAGLLENRMHIYTSETFRDDHLQQGYLYIKELLERNKKNKLPQVFICSSDMLAIGAMRAITEAGYKIPDDFGVMGCDDLEISAFTRPALTTIRQDRDELGRRLWEMTDALIHGRKPANAVLRQHLIIRDSC